MSWFLEAVIAFTCGAVVTFVLMTATRIRRLMYIKEEQLSLERRRTQLLVHIRNHTTEILEVLKGRKDGKRKISRKNRVSYRG